ncbi:N-acetylglucosaminyl transferase component-domain-containing protein [Mycena amicta]|nr:N-acetylglucosaminyl transferase component-domain-containing protein [Mycena amicta]
MHVRVTMSTPTAVFWPTDLQHASGHCYGWRTPTLCVATVSALPINNPRLGAILLGNCSFNGRLHIDLAGVENFTLIYYHRHPLPSLRFYSLPNPHPDIEPRQLRFSSLLGHDFTRPKRPGGLNATVINQFNSASSLEPLLQKKHAIEISKFIFDLMDAVLYVPRRVLSFAAAVPSTSLYNITTFSLTVQQLDVRTKQILFLAQEVEPLRTADLSSIPVYSERYTSFFNTVWLILNDITIGIAFGSFLCENDVVLAQIINGGIEVSLIHWIRWALQWLDSWPAGLKLNTELSRFYSHTFSDLVGIWDYAIRFMAPHLPALLFFCGIASSVGGMTTAIALFSDLFGLLTVHVTICYHLSRVLYARFLSTGGSLWNLFRGKRFNVLRNRTDNWEYDTDQLLFGTILFTLLAFLFPTVLAYYALFALLRLSTILLNAVLETQLAFMNHFPLFALMLRAKDPWRLPHDIYVAITYEPELRLVVKNQPVPLSMIFAQYIGLWRKLAAHYNPLRLLWLVLRGGALAPIPRGSIRYFT